MTDSISDTAQPRGGLIGFLNGESSLAKTYWLGIFAAGSLSRILSRVLNREYLSAQTDDEFARLDMIGSTLNIVFLIWAVLMCRALIRCCYNNRTPGFWGWAAIVIAFFTLVVNIFLVFAQLFPQFATPRFMIQLDLSQVNKTLPHEMEPGFWLNRVEIAGDDVVYHFRDSGYMDENTKAAVQALLTLHDPETQGICREIEGWFHSGITAVVYRYQFTNGAADARLEASTCLNWLAEK